MAKNYWAYYDISTDKIYGCEPNTLSYFHEEGHQHWSRKGLEQAFQQISWIIILVCLPVVMALAKNAWMTLFAALPLFFYLISEIHAWIYVFNKWRNRNGHV